MSVSSFNERQPRTMTKSERVGVARECVTDSVLAAHLFWGLLFFTGVLSALAHSGARSPRMRRMKCPMWSKRRQLVYLVE